MLSFCFFYPAGPACTESHNASAHPSMVRYQQQLVLHSWKCYPCETKGLLYCMDFICTSLLPSAQGQCAHMPCLVLQVGNEPQQPSISWVYQLQAEVFVSDGNCTHDRVQILSTRLLRNQNACPRRDRWRANLSSSLIIILQLLFIIVICILITWPESSHNLHSG